jgi:S-formylglutathione hydrolase FrmB
MIDCGVADFFIEINRDLHRRLLKEDVPHDYVERPGAHNWMYWDNAIKYQVLFFSEFFKKTKHVYTD